MHVSIPEPRRRRLLLAIGWLGTLSISTVNAQQVPTPPRESPSKASSEIGLRQFRVEDASGVRTVNGGRITVLDRRPAAPVSHTGTPRSPGQSHGLPAGKSGFRPTGRTMTSEARRVADRIRMADRIRLAQGPPGRPGQPAEVPSIQRNAADEPSAAYPDPLREPSRLRNLPAVPGLTDPAPDPEVDRRYAQFIERTIDPQKTLDLIVDRPRILEFKETPTRLYMAQDSIASYQIISDTEIAIVGVSEGRTVLTIWVPDPDDPTEERVLSYLVRVAEDPEYKERLEAVYAALEKEINRHFPDSFVRLALIGDRLMVRGQAKDVVEAAQIIRIAEEHAPPGRDDQDETKVSSITQTVFSPFANSTRTSEFGDDGLSIERLAESGVEGESRVINMLEVPGEQQVMLRIIVAEVNRSAVRQIGANLALDGNSTQFLSAFPAFNLISSVVTGQMTEEGGTFSISRGDFGATLSALRRLNLAKTLAEPTLVALNGRQASFFAGGQFPIPAAVSTFGSTGQSVQFQPFGVQLQFVPYIVDRDKVRLTVNSSVSTRDESLTTNVGGSSGAGGTAVSGLQSRTFSTTVELREGETLGVAGLIQNNFGSNSSRVPLLGDLPYIGRAFSRDGTSADEQELLILITPEFQHPVRNPVGQTVPGADMSEPGDFEFFLKGQVESLRSEDFRSPVRTDFDKQMRYHYGEDLYLIGPFGYSFGSRRPGPQFPTAAPAALTTADHRQVSEEPADDPHPPDLPEPLPEPDSSKPSSPRPSPPSPEPAPGTESEPSPTSLTLPPRSTSRLKPTAAPGVIRLRNPAPRSAPRLSSPTER